MQRHCLSTSDQSQQLETKAMLAVALQTQSDSPFQNVSYDLDSGQLSFSLNTSKASSGSPFSKINTVDSIQIGNSQPIRLSMSQASRTGQQQTVNVGNLDLSSPLELSLFSDNNGKDLVYSFGLTSLGESTPATPVSTEPVAPTTTPISTPVQGTTTPSPVQGPTSNSNPILKLANGNNTPLANAQYDPASGQLDLEFDYEKVLNDPAFRGARHVDAVKVGNDLFTIELHPDNGPRDANGNYIYDRSTVENKFSLNIGSNRSTDGNLSFKLTDHPDGRGELYTVQLN